MFQFLWIPFYIEVNNSFAKENDLLDIIRAERKNSQLYLKLMIIFLFSKLTISLANIIIGINLFKKKARTTSSIRIQFFIRFFVSQYKFFGSIDNARYAQSQ